MRTTMLRHGPRCGGAAGRRVFPVILSQLRPRLQGGAGARGTPALRAAAAAVAAAAHPSVVLHRGVARAGRGRATLAISGASISGGSGGVDGVAASATARGGAAAAAESPKATDTPTESGDSGAEPSPQPQPPPLEQQQQQQQHDVPPPPPIAAVGTGVDAEKLLEPNNRATELPRPPSTGYWELINPGSWEQNGPEPFGGRARSASDANVLRRKGHLKEQDMLIDHMRRMHDTHTCEEVMMKMERWIAEHRLDPKRSRLKRLLPSVGHFFTQLKLVEAFREYDSVFHLSRRRYIPPNFAELRHIMNIAQVHASADHLKLITFDADGTLYADGSHFDQDNAMIGHLITLMQNKVQVAIVTAAGYPGQAHMFEGRLAGLLDAFRRLKLPKEVTDRFHIMGGECNYLLRVTPDDKRLEFVPEDLWQTDVMRRWDERDIDDMLASAQEMLVESAKAHKLSVKVLRKQRSVGIIPTNNTIYEVLEDIALTVQNQLEANVPFCAFNGGNDVFVDVGNKSLGLEALQDYLGAEPQNTMHVGDRFTLSGNDSATRDMCSVMWVANPEETGFFIKVLLKDIRKSRRTPYIE